LDLHDFFQSKAVTVGMPVAWHPPHSSPHDSFPSRGWLHSDKWDQVLSCESAAEVIHNSRPAPFPFNAASLAYLNPNRIQNSENRIGSSARVGSSWSAAYEFYPRLPLLLIHNSRP